MTLRNGTDETCTIEGDSTFTDQAAGSNCYTTGASESGCGIEDTDIRFSFLFFSPQCSRVNWDLMRYIIGLLGMASTTHRAVFLHFFGTIWPACQCGTSLVLTFLQISPRNSPTLSLGALQLLSGLPKAATFWQTSMIITWSLTLLSAVIRQVVAPTRNPDVQWSARIWTPMLLTSSVSFHEILILFPG